MSDKLILGIDTSNYTTSVALVDTDGELLANIKRPLPVKQGERGLRQSDAVFAHVKNFPSAMAEAREIIGDKKIVAVGVSERPRNLEGSYMPCFLTGVSVAESVSASLGVPLFRFSHQCGHIMAAIYSSRRADLLDKTFAAFHLSGGTTELLRVTPCDDGFISEHIGGTKDINAGQLIDRLGVKMGFDFPCGPQLERAALLNTDKIPRKKISLDGLFVNLSGVENMALSLYLESENINLTAAFIFDYIGNAILSMSEAYVERYGDTDFIYAGGVMSNSIIKGMLSKKFNAGFAEPAMSADNAVGIACLAKRAYLYRIKQ